MNVVDDLFLGDILGELEKIQMIPAPTFHERERACFIQQRFEQIGLFDVHIDDTGNVFGCTQASYDIQPIIISAHLDTVHAAEIDHTILKQASRWIGPGVGDNSLSLAVIIQLAKYYLHKAIKQPIIFCANTAEEGNGNLQGMRVLVDRFKSAPLCYIVLEGIGLGAVFDRGLGVKRFEIVVKTKGGHSWGDFGKPSAIHILAGIINKFSLRGIPRSGRSSYNFGTIAGGTTINSIAGCAKTELDLRSENMRALAAMENRLNQLINDFSDEDIQVEMKKIGDRPAGELIHAWLLEAAVDSLSEIDIKSRIITGSTDANYPLSLGYPAICICITNGGNVHTENEFIELEPIKQGVVQLMNLIGKLSD